MASATKAPEMTSSQTPRRGLSASLPPATIHKWLKDMHLIREFEIRCAQAYQQAKIGGFCHLYIGQEACAVGTIGAINPDDPVITAYRDHGHALARGMDAARAWRRCSASPPGVPRARAGRCTCLTGRTGSSGGMESLEPRRRSAPGWRSDRDMSGK